MSGSRRVAPLASRRRAVQLRHGRILVAKTLLVVLPLLALAWVVLASSWLAVNRIDVVGVHRLTPEQVRAAAAVQPRTPLARLDTGRLAARVGRLAPVESVQVSRSWPGTLRVQVTERTAVAGVLTDDGVVLVDRTGVAITKVASMPEGLVRLQVHTPGPTDPATCAAIRVHAELPPELAKRVTIVRAASASSVVLLLDTGKQVVWGSPGDTSIKAAAAGVLLGMPGDVFDVSSPDVVVRR